MRKTPRPFNQPTNLKEASALRRADKHRSDLYKSSILHYCPSLIGQIYLARLRPQQRESCRRMHEYRQHQAPKYIMQRVKLEQSWRDTQAKTLSEAN